MASSEMIPTQEPGAATGGIAHAIDLRVRYSETDQMGSFYNGRAFEWFECGRTELLRSIGLPYTEIEARGVFLPVVEALARFVGRARYDDLLTVGTVVSFEGRARLRCDVTIHHKNTGKPVASGHTIHAFMDVNGRPMRPPGWFLEATRRAQAQAKAHSKANNGEQV